MLRWSHEDAVIRQQLELVKGVYDKLTLTARLALTVSPKLY